MPKLAIYVPKPAMREIERWRHQINFSQVFMRAITEEIHQRSRAVEGGDEKWAAAAAFYRRKLAENSASLVDFGYQLGGQHILDCRLSPETIRRLLAIEPLDASRQQDWEAIEEAIGSDGSKLEARAQQLGVDDLSHPTWRTAIARGYLAGVAAAWKRVCDQIRSAR